MEGVDIKEMYESGMSLRMIAEEIGMSHAEEALKYLERARWKG